MILDVQENLIEVIKGNRIIRMSPRHTVYIRDVVTDFNYYHGAVVTRKEDGKQIADFSFPAYQKIIGYDHPIKLPSFPEPISGANQYLDFARIKPGDTVLDLGAYSGLTSILFSEQGARVIAVEADADNALCVEENLRNYSYRSGRKIDLLFGAVWNTSGMINFSSESNMGASVCRIVGERGKVISVPSYTLSEIAKIFDLSQIDFIKCDVEGAEAFIFEDAAFFSEYHPRIIIEPHNIKGQSTIGKVVSDLMGYGYTVRQVEQDGVRFPLLEAE